MAKEFKCGLCDFVTESPIGWRQHRSKSHGAYTEKDLEKAGLEATPHDRIKFMSGFKSLEEVRMRAPETEAEATSTAQGKEGSGSAKKPRLSKEEQEQAALIEEFERLRPLMVKKWKRRLKTPYAIFARISNDPSIALSDQDAEDGAEIHVDLFRAMGWLRAGKIEAIADVVMWHGATILARSEWGQAMLDSWKREDESQIPPGSRPQ